MRFGDCSSAGGSSARPLLRLDGMRIGDGADAVPIGEAEVLVLQYAGLLPGSSFTELRLRGLELTLQRDDDGRWQVRGLPGDGKSSNDPFSETGRAQCRARVWQSV